MLRGGVGLGFLRKNGSEMEETEGGGSMTVLLLGQFDRPRRGERNGSYSFVTGTQRQAEARLKRNRWRPKCNL